MLFSRILGEIQLRKTVANITHAVEYKIAERFPDNIPQGVKTVLTRVKATNVIQQDTDYGSIITANVYGLRYRLEVRDNHVVVARGDLRSQFLLREVPALDHICMPFIKLVEVPEGDYKFPELKADDLAMRLHLIMPGDICLSTEAVVYIGAGTQRSANYIRVR